MNRKFIKFFPPLILLFFVWLTLDQVHSQSPAQPQMQSQPQMPGPTSSEPPPSLESPNGGPPVTPPLPGQPPVPPNNMIPLPEDALPPDLPTVAPGPDGLSRRDPFRLPEYLIIKLRQKQATSPVVGIDESVTAVRRWPLVSYLLVGIIWDVKKPKAMFQDRVNNIHMIQVNDFIGNANGVVTSIQSGSVTVLEGKIPQIIKLKK